MLSCDGDLRDGNTFLFLPPANETGPEIFCFLQISAASRDAMCYTRDAMRDTLWAMYDARDAMRTNPRISLLYRLEGFDAISR